MNRRDLLALSLACVVPARSARAGAAERFDRGLLWRVARKDAAPSHVFGTIHVADPRVSELPEAPRRAFQQAKSLVVETLPDPYGRERFLDARLLEDDGYRATRVY